MRVVLQRVREASVVVAGEEVARIDAGLLALVGVARDDTPEDAMRLAKKTAGLRLFPSEPREGQDPRPFDLSVADVSGSVLVVSQFTLNGDTRRGNRPSWSDAAPGPVAKPLVEAYATHLHEAGLRTESGVFGADMQVALVNDGPVTLTIDSGDLAGPRRRT